MKAISLLNADLLLVDENEGGKEAIRQRCAARTAASGGAGSPGAKR